MAPKARKQSRRQTNSTSLFADLPPTVNRRPAPEDRKPTAVKETTLHKLQKDFESDDESSSSSSSSGRSGDSGNHGSGIHDTEQLHRTRSQTSNSPEPELVQQQQHIAKRPRVAEPADGGVAAGGMQADVPLAAAAQQEEDQVTMALGKIATHITQATKFVRASGLLRQLLASGTLTRRHRAPLFTAIRAAFRDTALSDEPTLRREFTRLLTAIETAQPSPDVVLGRAERTQMQVYEIWARVRAEIYTDDSFQFNKTMANLKAMVDALPEVTEEDEAAHALTGDPQQLERDTVAAADAAGLAAAATAAAAPGPSSVADAEAAVPSAHSTPARAASKRVVKHLSAREAEEADPFGLDTLLQPSTAHDAADRFGLDSLVPQSAGPSRLPSHPQAAEADAAPQAKRAVVAAKKAAVWSPACLVAMRRRALLDCVAAAQTRHKVAWARTSVELLVEHFHGLLPRFAKPQRSALMSAMAWVRNHRAARRAGAGAPTAKEQARDQTSFERARLDWSRVEMSSRGKVGASGDAKQQQWLG